MQRITLASLVAIFSATTPALFASDGEIRAPVKGDALQATREAVALGVKQAHDNHAADAAATFVGAIQSEGFKQLPNDEQYRALAAGAAAADDAGDHKTALEWSSWACAFPAGIDNVDLWHLRGAAAYDLKNYADTARTIATVARRWPQTLDRIKSTAIKRVSRQLAEDPSLAKARLELLDSLFDAKWLDDGAEPAQMWLDLARLYLNRNDTASAVAVAARIDSPSLLVVLRADKRYDRLTRVAPSDFDLRKASFAHVAASEERVRANPKRLKFVVTLQSALTESLQPEHALHIADDVIGKVGDGKDKTLYEDFEEQYVWILDCRAEALWQLGRWDEAMTQMRHAARRPENGQPNVSQALNLAGYYADLGRADDALDAISELGDLSPYGRMQMEHISLMAAIQRGHQTDADDHLKYLRTHRIDALSTYQYALLDANRLDEASALLVERLHNIAWRADALADIQTYADTPLPALIETREARLRAVIARPSVQTAVAEVGRIEDVPLASPST